MIIAIRWIPRFCTKAIHLSMVSHDTIQLLKPFPFPDSQITSVMNQWEFDTVVAANRNVQSRDLLMNEFMNVVEAGLDHEQKVGSKGEESQFIRTTPESEEVARKYMIMRRFQIANQNTRQSRNASLDPFQQKCINLTKEFREANSECLSQPCDPTIRYRSIDGCCNNLENPSKGRM